MHQHLEKRLTLKRYLMGCKPLETESEDDCVLLYRAHPVISSDTKQNNDFFIDVTNYEVVEDIMIVSDLLVLIIRALFSTTALCG